MTEPSRQADGRIVVETAAYRLDVSPDGLRATLGPAAGEPWLTLRPHAALDRTDGIDETLSISAPRISDGRIEVERRSTLWERAVVSIACSEEQVELRARVRGRGDLTDVDLLALRSLLPDGPTGLLPSGYDIGGLTKLYCPNPAHATGVRPAAEPAVAGVTGDGEPGRHHWFFTPSPLYFAWGGDGELEWLDLGIAAPVVELTFVQAAYLPCDGGFQIRLDYEGQTTVDGDFEAPALVFTPRVPDPTAGLRRHREDLVARGCAPPVVERKRPSWWARPIFCGWGAQCHLAERNGGVPAPAYATQDHYDSFLQRLSDRGVVPGTVVLDDKWQSAYGSNEPDEGKWPDLRGWIAERHARGQRVLLWWKAWDSEGLPPELCVRNLDGAAVAVDPSNPAARDALVRSVTAMLAPAGLDADGLKVDFTARTPAGRGLTRHGSAWGIALLHELLATVYRAAKEAKPDALVMTQAPHPAFVDVTDMIRLNDMIGGHASVVPQMRFRAEVVRAAAPDLLIDTDDWRVPSREAWREYLEVKPGLGIPSLYYATHLDATCEPLEPADYDAIGRAWARWEESRP